MKTDLLASNSGNPRSPQPPRSQGKVFDVRRPGRAAASPTSRPVVIGHKPGAQQRQISVSGIGGPEPRDMLDKHDEINVKPAHAMDAASSTPEATMQSVSESPAPPSASQPETWESSESSRLGMNQDALAAVAMEPEAPAPMPPPAPDPQPTPPTLEPSPDDPVHDAAPPSLNGQVVVSHHSMISDGPGRLILLLSLVLIFTVLVLDVILDVGIINSTIIPHTNFF